MKKTFWVLLFLAVLGVIPIWAATTVTPVELSRAGFLDSSATYSQWTRIPTDTGVVFTNDDRTVVLLKVSATNTITCAIPAANDTMVVENYGIVTLSNISIVIPQALEHAILTIPAHYNVAGQVTLTSSASTAWIKVFRLPKGGR